MNVITHLLALFGLHQYLLHYVHQLVSYCVCPLFAAGQPVFYGFFLELFR